MSGDNGELPAILAACEAAQSARLPWWQIGRTVARLGSGTALLSEPWDPVDRWEYDVASALVHHLEVDAATHWAQELASWREQDPSLQFVTILDEEYPLNLRLVFNAPPFLTARGELGANHSRSVAVVGTRKASSEGMTRARRLARGLAGEGVTVLSGLARGIDTAAHEGALEGGGRTVAVLGHGLLRPVYPAENRELAQQIIDRGGALVSQFRPDTPASKGTFPLRNVVMSGLAQGTVVVEAGETSGARMQARFAAEQGKRVWLLASLVEAFPWASAFVERYPSSTTVVGDVNEVLDELHDTLALTGELPPVAPAEERRRGEPDDRLVLFAS